MQLAMSACPYRVDFYKKLAGDGSVEAVQNELRVWADGASERLELLQKFYELNKNFGK